MNFSVIGGSGGGAGGPVGTGVTGAVGCGRGDAVGGGGAAFGLKRNRSRSADPGFGRSLWSASRCTSGAAGPVVAVPCAPRGPLGWPCLLDVAAVVADVPGH